MAGSNYLLDTVIVAAYLNQDAAVVQQLSNNVTVYVPSIVIGELLFGAYNSQRSVSNLQRVRAFAAGNTILNCDIGTADQYGQIRLMLRTKGRPIPENDIWIAAIALQYNLPLVTRDAHFQAITGLTMVTW